VKIQPIVEGEGEEAAFPVLLRRLRDESGAFDIAIQRPFRRRRSELVQEASLRRIVRSALLLGCDGVLILFDSDKECPKRLASLLQAWAKAEAREVPCEVVIAHCEYEAWFLASLEPLRGLSGVRADAVSPPDPESIRGAKEKLRAYRPGYVPVPDQASLSAAFDLVAAYRSCRSFRRLVNAFGIVASQAGATLGEWPPPSWLAEP
jgi:Domain of unknown function (DUF4276)